MIAFMSTFGDGAGDRTFDIGTRGLAATEAAFAARVTCTMAWMIVFISTFGDGAGDRTFGIGARDRMWGVWGSGVVRARAAKAGAKGRRAKLFP